MYNAIENGIGQGYLPNALIPSLSIELRTEYSRCRLMARSTNASVILNVMGAVGGALGPVAGIMFADYYVVHHRHYDIDSFYVSDSSYAYKHGWNFSALIAMAIGTFISLIGLFVQSLHGLYAYSWFLGVGSGFVIYALLMRSVTAQPVKQEVASAK